MKVSAQMAGQGDHCFSAAARHLIERASGAALLSSAVCGRRPTARCGAPPGRPNGRLDGAQAAGAARPSQVAFATADIRRALALLRHSERLEAALRAASETLRPNEGARATGLPAASKITRDSRGGISAQANTVSRSVAKPRPLPLLNKDDLCPEFCLLQLSCEDGEGEACKGGGGGGGGGGGLLGQTRRSQVQVRNSHETSNKTQTCERQQQIVARRVEREFSSRRSGSISMDHLNEIKTSAFTATSGASRIAICLCRRAQGATKRRVARRTGRWAASYGVTPPPTTTATRQTGPAHQSNSPDSLATSNNCEPQLFAQQQFESHKDNSKQQQAASWLRLASSLGIGKQPTSVTSSSSSCNNDKFTRRRESVDFEDSRPGALASTRKSNQLDDDDNSKELEERVDFISACLTPETRTMATSAASGLELGPAMLNQTGGSSLSLSDCASPASAGSSAAAAAQQAGQGNKNFGKLVGKKAARLKELVLQNLGKADRTQDELFDLYESNFHKQQQQASKLAKEFKNYLIALRHFHEASRSLGKCVQQSTCDYQSARHDLVCENLAQLEALQEDLLDKLQEQVLKQVGEYLSKFGEIKERISKRHRKLIDYDKSRRLYELMLAQMNKRRAKQQSQQALGAGNAAAATSGSDSMDSENYQSILRGLKFLSQQQQQQATLTSQQEFIASQLVDEARLLKFREQFNQSKLMYESINGELHDELPVVYEKKMRSLLKALQSHFAINAHYHANAAKLVGTVSEVIDELPHCPTGGPGGFQHALEARKLSSDAHGDHDHRQPQTLINRHDQDDEEDDDDDDDSYESSSNSSTTGGGGGVSGGVSGADAAGGSGDKSRQAGGSSSGLGSSRGESSCSVGSSSPECPANTVGEQQDEENPNGGLEQEGCSREEVQGKAEELADCLLGAAAAAERREEAGGVTPTTSGQLDDELKGPSEQEAEAGGQQADADLEAEIKVDDEPNEQLQLASLPSFSAISLEAPSETPGVLYKVRTNYKYLAEDVDELCFEPNEILEVIEFDANQEPEEGWLMGVRQVNGQRGLFPANFTEPI